MKIVRTSPATAILVEEGKKPVILIATPQIEETFDEVCLQQAMNSANAPGVTSLVVNPDAHRGYGAPVGCVLVSPDHLYPGPVGPDISCSMSFLQTDAHADAIASKEVRRALINAISERIPTGAGKGARSVPKGRDSKVIEDLAVTILLYGATDEVCERLGIPISWTTKLEDRSHEVSGTYFDFALQNDVLKRMAATIAREGKHGPEEVQKRMNAKFHQLGSYGSGNHFGEAEIVHVEPGMEDLARQFGLIDGHVGFLSHCGSRGVGYTLAEGQFKSLQAHFERWSIPLPGDDKELVYAPKGTPEYDAYLNDMRAGANFAIVNHLLINALVLEAFQEVLPGTKGELVYHISHNIARREIVNGQEAWVHRKGATRAYPAGHFSLKDTPYADTGHPILLPGNPAEGSSIMVASAGAAKSNYSVNHGSGRLLGRKAAMRVLDQGVVDKQFDDLDIMSNCRKYPIDEAPAAYKRFRDVIDCVVQADLAREVARLSARFVIKDSDDSNKGMA